MQKSAQITGVKLNDFFTNSTHLYNQLPDQETT